MPPKIVRNPRAVAAKSAGAGPITLDAAREARREIGDWPAYAPTPLLRIPALAKAAGVADVFYKDESARLGLSSFKALGGAYAVERLLARLVEERLRRPVTSGELARSDHHELTGAVTVVTASAGNHGRSVAAGAAWFGCRSVVLVGAEVGAARGEAIAATGAELVRTQGDYDAAVALAARLARENGWRLVADTSAHGGETVCRDIMLGYTVMAAEALEQIAVAGADLPTHVFVQGGVGGLAAAVTGYLSEALGERAPTFVVVEPEAADCLLQSALAGRPAPASGDLSTVMGCLACREVSPLAWRVLKDRVPFFMTIDDVAGVAAMRVLADEPAIGVRIVAGESAGAGLAGLLGAANADAARADLGLTDASRVLLFGTEGANDPSSYARLVGRPVGA